MKTKNKTKKFNWITTLQRLAKRKTDIDRDDLVKLIFRASDWPTCACGQLCKRLPRTPKGAPEDKILFDYGFAFYNQICRTSWVKALETFRIIENRTTVLLDRATVLRALARE